MKDTLTKQTGITLIELLAALAILSVLISLTFGVLINGINYSKTAETNVLLQQDANYIFSFLTTQHETQSSYTIQFDQNPNASTITVLNASGDSTVLSSPNHEYSLYTSSSIPLPNNTIITPSSQNFFIKLVITDKKKPNLQFELQTTLSRM
ncbi:PulJ/GspJ family protein [Bacillus sp. Marseille-P3661]|uniref:PulJ/GspJ family protein n=1 Tax=Bacillus sp. Marseille-P3661 TaxID=1936234 RepID=UPI000C851F9A|nr:prepilin-type N-terminal cleavage/methylation domain-containing protein [Bacillus sp. Marseille-P3661]